MQGWLIAPTPAKDGGDIMFNIPRLTNAPEAMRLSCAKWTMRSAQVI